MVKEEFTYDSRDGKSQLHAVRYLPEETEEIRGVVQIVHGMAEYIERYEELAQFLTGKGFVVTGEDHLGHGRSVGRRGRYGYFCEQDPATVLVRDVHRLKKMTQALYPGIPYVLLGHSMGSFLVRNYMFRYGTGINGAIVLGTGVQSSVFLRVCKAITFTQKVFWGSAHVSKFIHRLAFKDYNRAISNPRTPNDWLTRDEKRVDSYNADPHCGFVFTVNGFSTLFELLSRLNEQENLARIPKELPILMLSGSEDPVGDYGKGVQKVYEGLTSVGLKNIKMKIYEGDRHELVNELNRDEVMDDIYSWLEDTVLNGKDDGRGAEQTE
ncbi:MAG: alpha/beta fold hydrolase [Acetatifactor sp.]